MSGIRTILEGLLEPQEEADSAPPQILNNLASFQALSANEQAPCKFNSTVPQVQRNPCESLDPASRSQYSQAS